jgi:uncharacterized membrane protein
MIEEVFGYEQEDIDNNKIWAILAYILFFIPLLTARQSPFAMYHANQGLMLFIVAIASIVFNSIISAIPIIGWIISIFVSIAVFIFWIIGIINAASGKAKPLPIIGGVTLLK